jgi:hypothetical protein
LNGQTSFDPIASPLISKTFKRLSRRVRRRNAGEATAGLSIAAGLNAQVSPTSARTKTLGATNLRNIFASLASIF